MPALEIFGVCHIAIGVGVFLGVDIEPVAPCGHHHNAAVFGTWVVEGVETRESEHTDSASGIAKLLLDIASL